MTSDKTPQIKEPESKVLIFPAIAMLMAIVWLAVAAVLPMERQFLAISIALVLIILFLAFAIARQHSQQQTFTARLEHLHAPLQLATHHNLFERYTEFAEGMQGLTQQSDPVLQEFARFKLVTLVGQVKALAEGRVVFSHTET